MKVSGSEYLPEEQRSGRLPPGIVHEDIEALGFPDASFDAVVSNDVLEHVNDVGAAMRELTRIVKPGGILMITVPFLADQERSVKRATLEDGQVRHLLEPRYHGNPVSSKGSLVFTDFGWDFVTAFQERALESFEIRLYWSRAYGHLGGPQILFVGSRGCS